MGITSPRQVVKICDKAVLELKEHTAKKGENRFTNLLLRLSPLRSLQPDVLEELFFAGLIGNVQIDSVVPYILKMESSEYTASSSSQPVANNNGAAGNFQIHSILFGTFFGTFCTFWLLCHKNHILCIISENVSNIVKDEPSLKTETETSA